MQSSKTRFNQICLQSNNGGRNGRKANIGRIKACTTINRELRRAMNDRATELANMIMDKAMSGDSTAMLAASNLLLAANA